MSYPNLREHTCTRIGQRGGHVSSGSIDQSFIKESMRSNLGVVTNYTYTKDKYIIYDDIYKLFDLIYDPLIKLLEENVERFGGIVAQTIYRT